MTEEVNDWANRPLDGVYAAIFIDAIIVKVRDGQVANRPICVAIGSLLDYALRPHSGANCGLSRTAGQPEGAPRDSEPAWRP